MVEASFLEIDITALRNSNELRKIEIDIYQTLNWRLNLTTPMELAKLFLLYANSDFDFGPILINVNSYILVCLIGKVKILHINHFRCRDFIAFHWKCLHRDSMSFLHLHCFRSDEHAELQRIASLLPVRITISTVTY